ncbi:MAG TPA: amidase family protein, partial [Acidimicrobiales bacterium]|nr:amidase family protein [Acidimicrobiales bacterium]
MTPQVRVHAFGDDALADHDAVALADLIRRGDLSAAEVESAAVERIQKVTPTLRAVVHEAYDRPRRSSDTGAPLFGVPTLIKDNTDVAAWPTNNGSEAYTARPAKKDGAYTRQFVGTGVTVLGKTRMPEFGLNATTEFRTQEPTVNPW